jgi:Zn-dependent protease with chaperone function
MPARTGHDSDQTVRRPLASPSGFGWLSLQAVGALSLLFGLIAGFCGTLIAAVFELFRLVDSLLAPPWTLHWGTISRAVVIAAVGVLLARLAWWLSVTLLGVLTSKYDAPPLDNAPIVLLPSQEPRLYGLVADVCAQLTAPRPDGIRIAHAAECYVAEQREFAVRPHRSLTLVLGLPQLLVLSVNELQCIISHEMAHFRSRDTTVVVFLYRFTESLRRVLAKVQRHRWRSADPIYWVFTGAHAFILRLARPIQRAQELNADAISAALYGGDLAVQTLLTDWLLANQFEETCRALFSARARQEPSGQENVFQLFKDRWHHFSAAGRQYLERRLAEEETGLPADSRPTFTRRFERMRQFPTRHLLESPPAADLLLSLPSLSEALHWELLAAAEEESEAD